MEGRSKDTAIPLVLIGVGIVIYGIAGFAFSGPDGAVATVAGLGIAAAIQTVLGIVALYITAAIMGIDFGPLGQGILKLLAVFIFPDAISALIPVAIIDWIVSIILYLWLLSWLFDLEPLETVVCAVVIFLVRLAAAIFIISALMTMM